MESHWKINFVMSTISHWWAAFFAKQSDSRWRFDDGRNSQISCHYGRGRRLHGHRRNVDGAAQFFFDLHDYCGRNEGWILRLSSGGHQWSTYLWLMGISLMAVLPINCNAVFLFVSITSRNMWRHFLFKTMVLKWCQFRRKLSPFSSFTVEINHFSSLENDLSYIQGK